MSDGTVGHARRVSLGEVLLAAIAAVSWALIGMAGVAALGLHLLGADAAGSLGTMTAAVVALGAGGSVTPSGDVSAFGLEGAQADTALQITPLGVSLVGALLLSWFFLRSLRGAGVVIAPAELLARAGTVAVLFVAMLGGLAWAGHDVITIDGGSLGLDQLPGGGLPDKVEVPGLGDIGGLLPDRLGDLADANAKVGFTVETVPTLLGGLGWVLGVLVIALLASRRTPLPRGWTAVHRVVRPAASALVTVLLVAVLAGFSAAAYAAISDDNPKRIAGAALVGAPNGVWLGIPIGLFIPWDGSASGPLVQFLPDPLDKLLSSSSDQSVSLGRLAELDGRGWLLGVAAALMMLFAGVLTAARTPFVRDRGDRSAQGDRSVGVLGFAGRCAVRLAIVTALAMPLLAWLTEVSVDASLSVLGVDAFDSGIELRGQLGMALLLGALWGAGTGAAGALLACATGAAGRQAAPLARGDVGAPDAPAPAEPYGETAGASGPYTPGTPFRPANPDTNPYLRLPDELREPGPGRRPGAPPPGPQPPGPQPRGNRSSGYPPPGSRFPGGEPPGRRSPGTQPPGGQQPPGSQDPGGVGQPPGTRPPNDVYGAPTVAGPFTPPPGPGSRRRRRSSQDGPPPPPPDEPPPPSGRPPGRR
ncbi:streptophobe family protein [Streptomyces sp. NBC_00878]|uniref:streptophobe family protein n=1 Tax=Streptomyces sp. NBC_00878 TaxID=2975854 RepID=UPI00225B30F8|nr:streptophobe family protein [Streptomyces sp. NBC_00878]MCX4909861.1 streptophobe family protein [Streptomyces sp. NBC_00878]